MEKKDFSKISYGCDSKIENNIIFVNRNDFQGPHLNYQDLTIPLNLKNQIEGSVVNEKPFLKLFEYNDISLWWLFHYGPFFNDKFSKTVHFISKFSEFVKSHHSKTIEIHDDFEMLDIIKQICFNNNINLEFSKSQYIKFRLLTKTKKFLRKIVREYRFKKRIKNRIKNRINQYNQKFNSTPDIDDKIVFVIPTTFRRSYFNPDTMNYEKGEYVLQPIIDILKNKHQLIGMSTEHSNTTINDDVLSERFASDLDWFPQEILFRSHSKKTKHKIFLHNFTKLVSNKKFQELFSFQDVNMWTQIQPVFEQVQEEIYLPYWLNLIDNLSSFLENKKPKLVFLIGETDAPSLALIHACKKNKIKTITIQHGEGFEDCEHNVPNLSSDENPLGCPFPDKMLLFGQFAKDTFVKHGYPEDRFTIIGNPLFVNLKQFENSNMDMLYKKYNLNSTKKIILSTTSRYQGFSQKYNFDELVWDSLLKNFGSNGDYVVLLKPHPYEDHSPYEKIFLKHNEPKNAKIIEGDILELIKLSNILVSSLSTSIVDAICLNKPVIEMIWDGVEQKQIPFDDFNITIHSTLEQLSKNIYNVLNNKSIQENVLQNRDEFLHKHFQVPTNSDKIENILDEIL